MTESTQQQNQQPQQPDEGPEMPLPPAIYPLCIAGSALMLEKHLPIALPETLLTSAEFSAPASYCTLLLALGFMAWTIQVMRAHNTTLLPHRIANTLIDSGPFRFSRNPIYLGFSLLLLAVFFSNGNLWLLILLPLNIGLLQHFVVLPEERNLSFLFDEDYKKYQNKVRRWL